MSLGRTVEELREALAEAWRQNAALREQLKAEREHYRASGMQDLHKRIQFLEDEVAWLRSQSGDDVENAKAVLAGMREDA